MIEWREKYNCYSADIARGAIHLSVAYNSLAPKGSESGYVVSVNNRRLMHLVSDASKGREAAIQLARKIVAEAAAELEAP